MSDFNSILEGLINKKCVIFTIEGFVYNCVIKNVSNDFVQFFDLKKHYLKIIRISEIKEVQIC